ncbi:MAG: NADH-quinone oxidoreductase subunit NuoE [Candidatus Coatesbacteria bacterium]|nr:NADH-quinone oxidoreductase subunit NuoE [Candidatus Coatesbacteria bacterium]
MMRGELIPALAAAQRARGYLSEEALAEIAATVGVSESEVYGVATFYAQFRFRPPAEHTLKVCLGTACHVRGGEMILEALRKRYKVNPGETTRDGKLALERVACLGCCALAPVVVFDGKIHGKMTPESVHDALEG